MNKQILKYMLDFESRDLKKDNNVILIDGRRVNPLDFSSSEGEPLDKKLTTNPVPKYSIDNDTVYVKKETIDSMTGLACSRMLNDLGIATPIIVPLKHADEPNTFYTASQDLSKLECKGLDIKCAINVPQAIGSLYKNVTNLHNEIWDCFHPEVHDILREFMTEECFNELVTKALLDEIRTYTDSHFGNIILYKTKGSDKYEGIIPIDLEYSEIFNKYHTDPDEIFKYFKMKPYRAFNFTSKITDPKTLKQRLDDIVEEAYSGNFSMEQLNILKKALNYDLPKLIKDLSQKYKMNNFGNIQYEMFARLWDFNREHLGKNLGM